VNCASIGCPNIQAEAFTAVNTESLLDAAARDYLQHPRGLSIQENSVVLSSIFDWYRDDFGDSQEQILKTLAQYLDDDNSAEILSAAKNINYAYDWSLNDLGG